MNDSSDEGSQGILLISGGLTLSEYSLCSTAPATAPIPSSPNTSKLPLGRSIAMFNAGDSSINQGGCGEVSAALRDGRYFAGQILAYFIIILSSHFRPLFGLNSQDTQPNALRKSKEVRQKRMSTEDKDKEKAKQLFVDSAGRRKWDLDQYLVTPKFSFRSSFTL